MKATPGMKFAEKAYEGSATLGKIVGIFSSIFGILIGLVFLIGGLILAFKKNTQNTTDTNSVSTNKFGWILFVIGIFIIIASSFSLYLTMNFKVYQAAQGVGAVVNVFDNATD